jgi:hypothetical protein
VCWCLESVVEVYGTTIKKASKKEAEIGVLKWVGIWWGVLKVCILVLKKKKKIIVKYRNGSMQIGKFIFSHV